MTAAKKDFIIEQGSKFQVAITAWQDKTSGQLLDLTDALFRMDIRQSVSSTSTILSLSSPSDGITVDTVNSIVTIVITAVQTAAITSESMVYDLEYVPDSVEADAVRWLQGSMTLSKEVTR